MAQRSAVGAAEPTPTMSPVPPHERIEVVDILRGFAIFGILLVNMELFSSPFYPTVTETMEAGPVDRVVGWLIRFLAEGKFYTLFSLLFGVGFSLQMSRARARDAPFVPFYQRRLFVLLLIGWAHAFWLWAADVLAVYALLGFLLLLFPTRSDRTVIRWAVLCLAIPILINAGLLGLVEVGGPLRPFAEQVERRFVETAAQYEALAERSVQVYSQGSFREIMAQRAQDVRFNYLDLSDGWLVWSPHIFAMFLIGMYAGRHGLLQDVSAHRSMFRRALQWGFGLGVAGNLVFVAAGELSNPVVPSLLGLVGTMFFVIGATGLCFCYASAIVLLAQVDAWRKRFAPLAAVGRMALSNYLLQSVVCTTIFYSYGLGLYGQVGPAVGVALTVAIFVIQVALSGWWLRRFRFGPLEWVWRSLTYGKRQPMRLAVREL